MKRKLITLEIYADDKNIDDSEACIEDLISEINYHMFVLDGTIDIKMQENHISLYKQLSRVKGDKK